VWVSTISERQLRGQRVAVRGGIKRDRADPAGGIAVRELNHTLPGDVGHGAHVDGTCTDFSSPGGLTAAGGEVMRRGASEPPRFPP
jgi:hypothetical protein